MIRIPLMIVAIIMASAGCFAATTTHPFGLITEGMPVAKGMGITESEQRTAVAVVNSQIGTLARAIGILFVPSDGIGALIERIGEAIDSADESTKERTTQAGHRMQLYFEWYIMLSRGIQSAEWAEIVTQHGTGRDLDVALPMMATSLYEQTQEEMTRIESVASRAWEQLATRKDELPSSTAERLTRVGFAVSARELHDLKHSKPGLYALCSEATMSMQLLMAGMIVSSFLKDLVYEDTKPIIATSLALHAGANMLYTSQMKDIGLAERVTTNIHRSYTSRSVTWAADEKECDSIAALHECVLAKKEELVRGACLSRIANQHWQLHEQQTRLYQLDFKIVAINAYLKAKTTEKRTYVADVSGLSKFLPVEPVETTTAFAGAGVVAGTEEEVAGDATDPRPKPKSKRKKKKKKKK